MTKPAITLQSLGIFFSDVVERIKSIEHIETNREITKLLGMETGNFNRNLDMDVVPIERVVSYALKHKVSIDYLLTGIKQ